MSIGDIRYTVLQVVNEVQRKLGLSTTSNLTGNKVAIELIDHVNDTVSDISDFGNWMEQITTAKVTAFTSVRDYTVSVSGVIKNIGDVYLSTRRGPLQSVDVDTMRVMTRVTALGQPSQYSIFGTDVNGNPVIRVRPTPDLSQDGSMFSILYYKKPSIYTTNDTSTVIPFPARLVVLGTLARYTLRENGGAPTDLYTMYFNDYERSKKNSFARFNSATGWDISFTPGNVRRGRR